MNNTNNPQQQYRILRSNEIIQKGDQYKWSGNTDWYDCRSTIGKTVQQNVDAEPRTFDTGSFRRPLPIMPGYRYLEENEVIKTGDEFWSIDQNVWTLTTFQGFTPEEQDLTYRRKLAAPEPTLDPGEGYRLLKDDEVIQEGDEYWATSCKVWDYSTCVGSTPEKQCCVYRRKIAPHNGVSVCELGKVYTAGAVPYLTVGTDHFS